MQDTLCKHKKQRNVFFRACFQSKLCNKHGRGPVSIWGFEARLSTNWLIKAKTRDLSIFAANFSYSLCNPARLCQTSHFPCHGPSSVSAHKKKTLMALPADYANHRSRAPCNASLVRWLTATPEAVKSHFRPDACDGRARQLVGSSSGLKVSLLPIVMWWCGARIN